MNIVMFTNTYMPHVGGVARSVSAFAETYRDLGHRVLVVAPEFTGAPQPEHGVVRIAALQNFNGSDFSVALPVSGLLTDTLDRFCPDIVHSHHPYLLGMTAVRIARYRRLPLVFTHHTLYEQYTHYVPGNSPALARFVIELATRYANLTDQVFAPSESVGDLLCQRGVRTPIAVVPTGVDLGHFGEGDGGRVRARWRIPPEAFVVGHVGRLAPEKNLAFLADALAAFLAAHPRAHALVAGKGSSGDELRARLARVATRVHLAGTIAYEELPNFYHALDAFVFSSRSETQGMVLTEALAAGVPVVALDATGVREVVHDGTNGRLIDSHLPAAMASALDWVATLSSAERQRLRQLARASVADFSIEATAQRALGYYESLCRQVFVDRASEVEQWERTLDLIKAEWEIVKGMAGAAGAALGSPPGREASA